jgi:hypothetical protein
LTPDAIQRLAEKHGIPPMFENPHQKRLFGGSDDHSSLNIARTFTEFIGAHDADTSLSAIAGGRVAVHATAPSPQTMAHNLYSIAWQFFRNKFNLGRYSGKDPLIRFLGPILDARPC